MIHSAMLRARDYGPADRSVQVKGRFTTGESLVQAFWGLGVELARSSGGPLPCRKATHRTRQTSCNPLDRRQIAALFRPSVVATRLCFEPRQEQEGP